MASNINLTSMNLCTVQDAAKLAGAPIDRFLRNVEAGMAPAPVHVSLRGRTYVLFRRHDIEQWVAAGRGYCGPCLETDPSLDWEDPNE